MRRLIVAAVVGLAGLGSVQARGRVEIQIVDAKGNVVARQAGDGAATLRTAHQLAAGDRIRVQGSTGLLVRLDAAMPEALVYCPQGPFEFPIPEGKAARAYGSFKAKQHVVTARIPSAKELAAERNLALNPYDTDASKSFPHATTNNVCRNDPVFAARNVIDGVTKAKGHGGWPHQSWGPDKKGGLWLRIDFGRTVTAKRLCLVLRADVPHDAFFAGAALVGSNGTRKALTFKPTGEKQTFDLGALKVTWLELRDFPTPPKWAAITEVEVWGHDAAPPAKEAKQADLSAFLAAAQCLHWGNAASRYFLPALMERHRVSEQDLLDHVSVERFDAVAWFCLLTIASPEATATFAELVLDPKAEARRREEISRLLSRVGDHGIASQALSRALVPLADRIYPWDSRWARETQLEALRLIARQPVPEALSLYTTCLYHHRRGYDLRPIIEGLGRLQTPEALKELEQYWLKGTDESRGSDALAKAIASYGDDGVRVLRRIRAQSKPSWRNVLHGLRHAATPLAVQVVRQFRDDSTADARRMVFAVELAAGEPYRTPAVIAGLKNPTFQENILFRLTRSGLNDGAERASLMAIPQVDRFVRRLALSEGHPLSYRAGSALAIWRYDRQRAREPIRWLPPARGLALGTGQANYDALSGDHATVRVTVHLRNHLPRPLHIAFPREGCRLVVPDGWAVEGAYPPSTVWLPFLAAGQAERVSVAFRVKAVPFDGRRPAPMRLAVTIEPRHYEIIEGWTGTATFPPVEVVVPPPLDSADLDHWRAFLAQGAREGRLSKHGEIHLDRTGHGASARHRLNLVVRGNRVSSRTGWSAIPDDLLELRPDEVRRICAFLLEDDRFAHAIEPFSGHYGKYMPSARIHLESETKRAGWSGVSYTDAFRKGVGEIIDAMWAPRVREARRRLGVPQGGGQ